MKEVWALSARLSSGAKDMLLHMARVRPLPEPFPPEAEGEAHLLQLIEEELIVMVAEGLFVPSALGNAVVSAIQPKDDPNA